MVIDEALKCKESGESKTILLGHSGHGHVDMAAYDAYLSGKLKDYSYPEEKIKEALMYGCRYYLEILKLWSAFAEHNKEEEIRSLEKKVLDTFATPAKGRTK